MIYVFPSAEDTARVYSELEGKINRFKEYQDDSTYVYLNRSDVPFDPAYKRRGSFNPEIENALFAADTNEVIGPILEDGSYSLYKVTGIAKDSIPHVRARHIYLSITEDQRADKLEEARQFLSDINSGKVPFEEMAQGNQDGTAAKNGDLGYIPISGPTEVPEEIQKAVANGKVGQRQIVLTDETIHIVEIMSAPSSRTIQVAILRKPVLASGDTRRISERKAVEVSYQAKKEKTFEEAAEEQGLQIRIAPEVKKTDLGFTGVVESKDMVKWLYEKDRKEGDVSEATYVSRVVANKNFGAYVVAEVASIKEEGTAALKDVRDEVADAYIKDQKAKQLSKQLEEALASSTTMEELASAVNSQVTAIPVAKFSDDNVVNVRNSPKVQGALFALEEGAMSKPLAGGDGVYVVRVVGETEASKNRELNMENRKTFLMRMNQQRYGNLLLAALQEQANITDNRFRF
jgi:peptidyl-prolyl cis-trans isomerase D